MKRLDGLAEVTFGDLARMWQMGPVGILDFLSTLEAAEQQMEMGALPSLIENSVADSPVAGIDALLAALDEDWIDKVSRKDPRFAAVLPPIRGTLFEAVDALTSSLQAGPGANALLQTLAEAVPSIRERVERIRGMPLEVALRELMAELLQSEDKRVDSLLVRLHWSGQPTAYTLEEAGKLAGVSRERIRQLEKRILGQLNEGQFYLPQVDAAMRLLAERAPLDLDEAAALLQQHRISAAPFHPRSLLAVASGLQRTPLVQLDRRKSREILVREPVNASADRIIEIAYRQLSQVGTTNISEVAGEAQACGCVVSEEEIVQILKLYAGAEFTEESWFWCPSRPHCNLVTQARKMLSVVTPIAVATLREGMKRAMRFRRISGRKGQVLVVPTRAALLRYLEGHPDFNVNSEGMVRYSRPLDFRYELPISEQIMVQVLGESPSGVLDRSRFQEACVSRGLNRNTFSVLTTYSPVLQLLGFGLWSLRGRHVDPAAVEVMRQLSNERPREKRVADFGWTAEGRLWLAIRLPNDPTGVLPHVPSAISRYLVSQEYSARTEGGSVCGRVRIYENGNSSGYAPFLRQAGADEGDILLAEFDLSSLCVVLRLMDEEQLEELAEPE
jgi:hypothetical protein